MLYINKWLTFSASIFCQLSAGLTYCFSLYAGGLKEKFGYSQEQIDELGSACNFGGFFAIVAGLVYDQLEGYHRLGPRLTILIATLLNLGGYSLLWFAAVSTEFNPAFWQVALIAMLACNGGTWTDMAALVTNARNWPNQRGTVIGILKSCVGLSASVFTSIYVGFFQPDALDFLLFLAVAPALVNLLCLPFINRVPFPQASEHDSQQHFLSTGRRFTVAGQILVALALYQMTTAVLSNSARLALTSEVRIVLALGTVVLISMVVFVPISSGGLWAEPAFHHPSLDLEAAPPAPTGLREPLLEGHVGGEHVPEEVPAVEGVAEEALVPLSSNAEVNGEGVLERAEDETAEVVRATKLERILSTVGSDAAVGLPSLGPLQCIRSPKFWLLWCVCLIGEGSGLVFLNNLGQLVQALGGTDGPAVLVSLFSVMNCGGRIFFGYVPERCLHLYGIPRPAFLVAVVALTAVINVLNAFAPLHLLFVSALLAGFAFGGIWSLMSAITSDIFGLRYFASNYSLIQLAPAAGGFLIGSKLVGILYDWEARKQGQGHVCLGPQCFRLAFLICAGLSLLATGAAAALLLVTRQTYKEEGEAAALYNDALNDTPRSLSGLSPQGSASLSASARPRSRST